MLDSFHTENYCALDIHLKNLRRVNVIVGDNGTGKTRLLKSILDKLDISRHARMYTDQNEYHLRYGHEVLSRDPALMLSVYDKVGTIGGLEIGSVYFGSGPATLSEPELKFIVESKGRSLTLDQCGSGVRQSYLLACSLAANSGGHLLIDDLYGVHTWGTWFVSVMIHHLADAFDVQVFLATHSDDYVRDLVEIGPEDTSAYLLKRDEGTIKVVHYPGVMLKDSIRVGGVDIRRL